MDAILLAGGLGTRLSTVVNDRPKPMARILNRPFLEYLLDYWITQGVERFLLSVGYRWQAIQCHFGASYRGVALDYVVETEPLGTGGGLLLAAQRARDENVLVINGDTFSEIALTSLEEFHISRQADVSVSLVEVSPNTRYGAVVCDEEDLITSFEPTGGSGQIGWINGGIYLFRREIIMSCGMESGRAFSLEEHFLKNGLLKGNKILGFRSEGRFLDIGVPEDYAAASHFFGGAQLS